MKKNWKVLIIAVLVVSMVLSLFAGCSNKPFAEKYGITISDKTFTYDGQEHKIEVSVDSSILGERPYTVEYTYMQGNSVLSGSGAKDAGEYQVKASVLVKGEKEPTELTAKLTINKKDISVDVGTLFLRQGASASTLGNPNLDAQLVNGEKFADLGSLSYVIYDGSSVVADLTTLKASLDVNSPYKAEAKFATEPKNYNVKFNNGKLYVLEGTLYDDAETLKNYVKSVPTSETINTFTYPQMREFVSNASYITNNYKKLNTIQSLMCGTVNEESISQLLKTARDRLETVYDIEFNVPESSIGNFEYVAVKHQTNDLRQTTDDDFKTEFRGDRASSKKTAEYKDIISFKFTLTDKTKYKFIGFKVGSKVLNWVDLAIYGTTETAGEGNSLVYAVGVANATAPASSYYGEQNKGIASGGIPVDNSVLGALDGSGYIEITPIVNNIYTVKLQGQTANTFATKANMETQVPSLSSFTLSSKLETIRKISLSEAEVDNIVLNGTSVSLAIYPKTGYVISEVEIGDQVIAGSSFDNYIYNFVVDENLVNNKNELVIKVTFIELYQLGVNINSKIISNTDKDAIYDTDEGKVVLEKLSQTVKPTMTGDKALSLTANPSEDYILTSLVISGKKNGVDFNKDYTEDVLSAVNGKIEIDLKEDLFDSNYEVTVNAVFTKDFPVVVTGGLFGEGEDVRMSGNNGVFTSKYGTVSIMTPDKQDTLTRLHDGQNFFLVLTANEGYVPKQIKLYSTSSGRTKTLTIENDEKLRYRMMINDSQELYFGANLVPYLPSDPNCVAANAYPLDATTLAVGSDLVVEVMYEKYYWIDYSIDISASAATIERLISGVLDVNTGFSAEEPFPAGHGTDSNIGVIKVGNTGNTYYTYYKDTGANKVGIKVTANEGKKIMDTTCTIGAWDNSTRSIVSGIQKNYSAKIDDIIYNTSIKPGDTIEVVLICDSVVDIE